MTPDPYSAIPYVCDVCGADGTSIVRDKDGQRVGCDIHPVKSDRLIWGAPINCYVPTGWRWRLDVWRWRFVAWWKSRKP